MQKNVAKEVGSKEVGTKEVGTKEVGIKSAFCEIIKNQMRPDHE